jgi:hypothetical protein
MVVVPVYVLFPLNIKSPAPLLINPPLLVASMLPLHVPELPPESKTTAVPELIVIELK